MNTYLDQIALYHRRRAANDKRDLSLLSADARSCPPRSDFLGALRSEGLAIIAEIKRRSPSKGDLNLLLDVDNVVQSYELGGAAAVSVLTDTEYFGGSEADLRKAAEVTSLPLLRKDFTVSERDIYDAKLWGASAVLLIVAILDSGELKELAESAHEIGLATLIEVHDESELVVALEVEDAAIGVNQRDLRSFQVDSQRAKRLVKEIPSTRVRVAESGVTLPSQAEDLYLAGYDAILMGEILMRAENSGVALSEFSAIGRAE